MRLVSRILGAFMMAGGGAILATSLVEALSGGDGHTSRGVYAGLIVFFSAMTIGGWQLWRAPNSRGSSTTGATLPYSEPTDLMIEQHVLAAAARSEGRVTVGEVAMTCRIPIARAKKSLDAMVTAGAAELLLTERGESVYRIGGILTEAEKEAAVDPLEDVLQKANRQ